MRLYTLFITCLGVAVSANKSINPSYVSNISGGNRVKNPSPWHAGIYTKTTEPYKQICGGTLVTKCAVISAAHCFSHDGLAPLAFNYAVAVGKMYRPWNDYHDEGVQKADVIAIRIPPRYQGAIANFQDDIAVVIAATEFYLTPYVEPACLSFKPDFDEEQLRDGQLGVVVGWGLTGENSPASQVLQSASLPNVAIEKCIKQSPTSFRSSITGDKICAGYNNGTAVCRGDSGGGLVYSAFVNYRLLYFLRGVVSTSPTSENMCNIYSWATFTHLIKHEHFIKSVVPDVEQFCVQTYGTTFTKLERIQNEETCQCPKAYEVILSDKVIKVFL
ncbi:clotting factor C [Manduca sexta]|nr:clotting factor C [Manduca sexta]KAG6460412.1 hypothetical protein O3G_MSEX011972 [Manduca sexta]